MQRRAAAAYFVLFMVVSAGAYAYIGMADRPGVDVSGPSYTQGDTLSVGDRTYTVDSISGGTGSLAWTDQNATFTETLEDNSTVSWQTVSWDGQDVETVTLQNGSTLQYNGSAHRILLNASADPPTVRFEKVTNSSIGDTFERGGTATFTLDDQYVPGGTITEVTPTAATVSWGSDYLVEIENVSDPTSASLIQQQNVTRLLVTDQRVENTLGRYPNGTQFVQYRDGGERLLDTYLPEPEDLTVSQGDTLVYDGNATTVGNISRAEIPLTWSGSKTITVDLSEGATVDLNGQSYLAHFPDSTTVQLTPNTTETYESYRDDRERINTYNERKSGLWAVTILSGLAGLMLLATAYLPVKD